MLILCESKICRIENEWNSSEICILHPGVAQGETIHFRHQHVGDDGVRPVAPRGSQRLYPITRNRHTVAIELEQRLEELAVRLAVVNDQYVSHETIFISVPCRTYDGQETHNHAILQILAEGCYEDVESFHGFYSGAPRSPRSDWSLVVAAKQVVNNNLAHWASIRTRAIRPNKRQHDSRERFFDSFKSFAVDTCQI